jgi:two-component system, OmpR family, phosphate regulon sensor histidine kinase PhoR
MKFTGRLVTGTLLVLLITVLVLVWTAEISLRRDLENNFAAALEREARLIGEGLPSDRSQWQDAILRFSRQSRHRITLVARNGVVMLDSEVPLEQLGTLENHATRPEIRAVLEGRQTGRDTRGSASIGRSQLYVAIAGGPGVLRVSADLDQVNQTVRRAQGGIVLAALAALLVGTLLAVLAARAIARPLSGIITAARSIAAGEAPSFPHSGIPDVDALVRALRQMHVELGNRFEALKRERAESATLVESMAEGVIAADSKGRVLNANDAARRLLGYEATEPLPALPQLFRSRAARELVDSALRGVGIQEREIELDGLTLAANARPLPHGGVMLVLRDLTHVRRLEAMRRDFVANVSHELKTPLTSISGYSETLLTEQADPETTRRFLQVILGNARRMQRLVDDLLDLSRIESGRWQPRMEEIDLRQIIQGVIDDVQEKSVARGVSVDLDLEPDVAVIAADEDAVRQVFFNLVDNALRYTAEGGTIVCRSRKLGEEIALSVSDTGAGISREHLPRIFERFYRADPSRSREEGGTGLGLAIVKHLVEAHGGRVAAESVVGGGTTITAYLPHRSLAEIEEGEPA